MLVRRAPALIVCDFRLTPLSFGIGVPYTIAIIGVKACTVHTAAAVCVAARRSDDAACWRECGLSGPFCCSGFLCFFLRTRTLGPGDCRRTVWRALLVH